MDPISVVASVASMVGVALKGIHVINQYWEKYSRAAITIASMTAQCSCVEFALIQVQDVIIQNPQSALRFQADSALGKHFSSVFGACQLVFSILNQKLKELVNTRLGAHGIVGAKDKLKQVWNDQEMKDLLRNIESQASAINLLLGALQMRSNVEIGNLLARRDSIRLLDKISSDATSLRSAEDARRRSQNFESVTPSLNSTFDDTEFTFDFELINTTTYRRAFNFASKKAGFHGECSENKENHILQVEESRVTRVVATHDEREIIEELVTDGAQRLSEVELTADTREDLIDLSGWTIDHGFGSFTPAPKMANIVASGLHTFEVAELITPSSGETEHIESCGYGQRFINDGVRVATDCGNRSSETLINPSSTLEGTITSLPENNRIMEPAAPLGQEERLPETCLLLVDLSLLDINEVDDEESSFIRNELMELKFDHNSNPTTEPTPENNSEWEIAHAPPPRMTILDFLEYHANRNSAEPSVRASILKPITREHIKFQGNELWLNPIYERQVVNPQIIAPSGSLHLSSALKYTLEELLHSSTSSKVVKGWETNTQEAYAIKVVSRNARGRSRLGEIHFEVAILQDLSHYNIICIHELIELEMQILIVMPYLSPCTLLKYIQTRRKGAGVWCFPEKMAWPIFVQLISGVEYLCGNLTVHQNITLDTVLFDSEKMRVVITGFKVAEIVSSDSELRDTDDKASLRQKYSPRRTYINPYFTAPETLEHANNGIRCQHGISIRAKSDLYSCGVILFAMLNGILPYSGNMLMTQFGPFHAIEHLKRVMQTDISQMMSIHKGDLQSYDLLAGLLRTSCRNRLSTWEVKNHPWLRVQPGDKSTKSLIRRKPIASNTGHESIGLAI